MLSPSLHHLWLEHSGLTFDAQADEPGTGVCILLSQSHQVSLTIVFQLCMQYVAAPHRGGQRHLAFFFVFCCLGTFRCYRG